jgi:plastocyanin
MLPAAAPVVAQAAPLAVTAGVGDRTVAGQAYLPGAFTVNVGDTVAFSIGSDDPHTITFGQGPADVPPDAWPLTGFTAPAPDAPPPYDLGTATFTGAEFLNTGILFGKTSTAAITFEAAGTFPFFCAIHPGMTGEVTVSADATPTTQAEADAAAEASRQQLLGAVEPLREGRTAAITSAPNADGTTGWQVFADASTDTGPLPGGGTGHMELLEFFPATFEIAAGDSVTWTASRTHSVTFIPEGVDPATVFPTFEAAALPVGGTTYDGTAAASSGFLNLGPGTPSSYTLSFPAEGTFPFFCAIHAELGQIGTLTVAAATPSGG